MALPRKLGLYRGWLGHHNLGDEAMWDACRLCFPAAAWSSLSSVWRSRGRRLLHKAARALGRECALYGGGTLINRSADTLADYRLMVERCGRSVPFFGTGVASHEFWRGTPDWEDRRQEWLRLAADLPEIGVRGPRSKRALEESGARNVVVSGDPAVVFHEPFDRRMDAIETGRRRLLVNYGDGGRHMWGDRKSLDAVMRSLLRKLADAGVELRMVSIWNKDTSVCEQVARESGVSGMSVTAVTDSAVEFLNLARPFGAALTMKLHAGILAACANVPFQMIAYRPKCLDFAESIGWEGHVVRGDEADADFLFAQCMRLLDRSRALSEELYVGMSEARARFQNYCARTLTPWLFG